MKLILLWLLAINIIYADSIVDDPQLLYQLPIAQSSPLAQKITLNWKFASLGDFTSYLQQTYAIKYKILSTGLKPSTPISLSIDNKSIEDLINQAASKFGYGWAYQNDMVIFRALNPLPSVLQDNKNLGLQWSLTPGDHTLRSALARWCKNASWQLIWNVRADYPIVTTWSIQGGFESAVNEVLKASQDTDTPLQAVMHDSNHVLEITSTMISR